MVKSSHATSVVLKTLARCGLTKISGPTASTPFHTLATNFYATTGRETSKSIDTPTLPTLKERKPRRHSPTPYTKLVKQKDVYVTRDRLDKYHRGFLPESLVPEPKQPPPEIWERLKKKFRQRSLEGARMKRPKVSRRARHESKMVRALRLPQEDMRAYSKRKLNIQQSLTQYAILHRQVNIDVYNRLLERMAADRDTTLLGEAVELYTDMKILPSVTPDQFSYYYLLLIAARANHLERALYFFREFAIRYTTNLEPRNLHVSMLNILWRMIFQRGNVHHARHLWRSMILHRLYGLDKGDYYVFGETVRPSSINESNAFELNELPPKEFLLRVLKGVSQNTEKKGTTEKSQKDDSITFLTLENVSEKDVDEFLNKMASETVDPSFMVDISMTPGSEPANLVQIQNSNMKYSAMEEVLEIFKHRFGLANQYESGSKMITLSQQQERRKQHEKAEIERAQQIDIVGLLKRSAEDNWLSVDFKFDEVIEDAYRDFRRVWLEKSQKTPEELLLDGARLPGINSADLYAAKVLERRRHRMTAELFASDNFMSEFKRYQEKYSEFRTKAQRMLTTQYHNMKWVPVIIGRRGEVFIPKSINIFEITDEKIRKAKEEYFEKTVANLTEHKKHSLMLRWGGRLRIRWYDVDKRRFVPGFFY